MNEMEETRDAINDNEEEDLVGKICGSQNVGDDSIFCDEYDNPSDNYSDTKVADVDESEKNTPSATPRSPYRRTFHFIVSKATCNNLVSTGGAGIQV